MVVAEGVARTLDPRLDIWKTCDPVVRTWIEENLGPKAKIEDLGKSVADLARLATHLPRTLAEAETAIARVSHMADSGVDLSPGALEAMAEMRRASDIRLLFGVAALMLLAAWLF
jgi:ubiquinone biosynthesis protein